MRDDSNFRGFAFVTFSGICHGLVIAALGLMPAVGLVGDQSQPVEVTMEPTGEMPVVQAEPSGKPAAPTVTEAPVAQPDPAPAPVVKKPTPTKVVKATPPAELPKARPMAKTENETPKAKDMVAVVSVADKEEMKPDVSEEDLQPVKEESPTGVAAADDSDEQAEEIKEESKEEVKEESPAEKAIVAPVPVKEVKEEAPKAVAAAPAPSAGAVKESAPSEPAAVASNNAVVPAPMPAAGEPTRSYLELKQKPGNRSPEYPMAARREGRQGNLELMYYVTRDGRVSQVKILQSTGSKDMDDEAIRTISQYRYVPGQEGWTKHPVVFALKGQAVQAPGRLRTAGAKGN